MSPQAIVVTLAIVTVMALVVSYAIWQHRPRTGATYLAVSTL